MGQITPAFYPIMISHIRTIGRCRQVANISGPIWMSSAQIPFLPAGLLFFSCWIESSSTSLDVAVGLLLPPCCNRHSHSFLDLPFLDFRVCAPRVIRCSSLCCFHLLITTRPPIKISLSISARGRKPLLNALSRVCWIRVLLYRSTLRQVPCCSMTALTVLFSSKIFLHLSSNQWLLRAVPHVEGCFNYIQGARLSTLSSGNAASRLSASAMRKPVASAAL